MIRDFIKMYLEDRLKEAEKFKRYAENFGNKDDLNFADQEIKILKEHLERMKK